MKTKIIVGLAIYAIIFLCGGLYVLHLIGSTARQTDALIMLHQVEILREHYLLQIRRVQTDLALRDTRFARDIDTSIAHVVSMERVIDTCFDCHHARPVVDRLEALKAQTRNYQELISRVMTIRANEARLLSEKESAFQAGEKLIEQVSEMIALTGARLQASTRRALASIRRTTQVLFLLLVAAPLISIGLGFVFVRGLTRPLGVLLESTRRLTAGDLDHRVTGLTHEFGELGESVNVMALSIKDQMAQRQRAEQMAMLGSLSAGLAHEIKNPLAGIKLAMDVLATEEALSEENREVARRVRAEAGRIETLMKSFLSFARPPRPQPAEIMANAMIESILAIYSRDPRLDPGTAGGIRLVRALGEVPAVTADPAQLEQVLINLILNALEAMPDGGTLTVRTGTDGHRENVTIDVIDTGKGIAPEMVEKIFEPFVTTKAKGTGLGLAISRQLVELQGGTLVAEPGPSGETRFTLRLPAAGIERSAP